MLSPTPDRFRGLARSSPWRWRALAFDLHRRPLHGPDHTLSAVVERGVGVEVRLADGGRHRQQAERTSVGGIDDGGDRQGVSELPFAWELPLEVDSDGFVQGRPTFPRTSDDPMWQDYQFVAMLDPVELADGQWRHLVPGLDPDAVPDAVLDAGSVPALAAGPPPALDVHRLDPAVRHGRDTWWAEVSPRAEYEPRCACCPLLFGQVSEDLEALAGGPRLRDRQPGLSYATRYLVALDVETGICVHVEHLDGDHAGRGFSVAILAVDGGVGGV